MFHQYYYIENKNFLQKCFRLKNLMKFSFLSQPLESKPFSSSIISYLRCYFQDLLTNISVVAAILPIMERTNIIINYDFANN